MDVIAVFSSALPRSLLAVPSLHVGIIWKTLQTSSQCWQLEYLNICDNKIISKILVLNQPGSVDVRRTLNFTPWRTSNPPQGMVVMRTDAGEDSLVSRQSPEFQAELQMLDCV